MSTTVPYLFRF